MLEACCHGVIGIGSGARVGGLPSGFVQCGRMRDMTMCINRGLRAPVQRLCTHKAILEAGILDGRPERMKANGPANVRGQSP